MVKVDQIRGHLDRSMDSNEIRLGVLSGIADVIAKLLSVIFERLWRMGELTEDWKKANVTPFLTKVKKYNPENSKPVSFISIPGKAMEQFILDVVSKPVKEKKVIR